MCHKTEETELCCNSQLERVLCWFPIASYLKSKSLCLELIMETFGKSQYIKRGREEEKGNYYQHRIFPFLPAVSIII